MYCARTVQIFFQLREGNFQLSVYDIWRRRVVTNVAGNSSRLQHAMIRHAGWRWRSIGRSLSDASRTPSRYHVSSIPTGGTWHLHCFSSNPSLSHCASITQTQTRCEFQHPRRRFVENKKKWTVADSDVSENVVESSSNNHNNPKGWRIKRECCENFKRTIFEVIKKTTRVSN